MSCSSISLQEPRPPSSPPHRPGLAAVVLVERFARLRSGLGQQERPQPQVGVGLPTLARHDFASGGRLGRDCCSASVVCRLRVDDCHWGS